MAARQGGVLFCRASHKKSFCFHFFLHRKQKSLFLLNASVGNVDANAVHTSTAPEGGTGPHSRQRGTGREGKAEDLGVRGGVAVASFGALSFNGDVIRKFFSPLPLKRSSASDWRQPSKESAPALPPSLRKKKKKASLGIMLKFPFLAPNRSYGSLLSNIRGHLCCKVGYYFFNAAGFFIL